MIGYTDKQMSIGNDTYMRKRKKNIKSTLATSAKTVGKDLNQSLILWMKAFALTVDMTIFKSKVFVFLS